MGNKLYNLMNWPEIEGIVYAESDEPNELLGGHLLKEGFLIQVFRPDAVEIKVNVATMKKTYIMNLDILLCLFHQRKNCPIPCLLKM